MNIEELTITKQGKPIKGKPLPKIYYSIAVPLGTDLHALRADLKKAYPQTFFNLRFVAPKASPGKPATSAALPPSGRLPRSDRGDAETRNLTPKTAAKP